MASKHSAIVPSDAEKRVRFLLAADATISVRRLAKLAGVSLSTASKYKRLVRSEREVAQ